MNISILGGGSWGSALAIHLSKNGNNVKVWEFFKEQADEMQRTRRCKLLPDVELSPNIYISSNINEVLTDFEVVFVVVPSDKVESTIKNAAKYINGQKVVLCSKGFAQGLKLLSDVVLENVNAEVFCLYGPTHAEELCKGIYTGVVLAGKGDKTELKNAIQNEYLSVDLSEDVIGVQVASALKNILAVFIGIVDGLKLGDNTKAFIMTRGLHEIKEVGLKMGALEQTFYGLAGIGDIIVTCTSNHSRNRYVGEQIGKGRMLKEVLAEMTMIAEGVLAVEYAQYLMVRYSLNLPIVHGLYEILFNNKNPLEVIKGF